MEKATSEVPVSEDQDLDDTALELNTELVPDRAIPGPLGQGRSRARQGLVHPAASPLGNERPGDFRHDRLGFGNRFGRIGQFRNGDLYVVRLIKIVGLTPGRRNHEQHD